MSWGRHAGIHDAWQQTMDLIILSGIISAFALVAFLPMARFNSRLTLGAGLLFEAYLGLDDLATILPRLSPLWTPSRVDGTGLERTTASSSPWG